MLQLRDNSAIRQKLYKDGNQVALSPLSVANWTPGRGLASPWSCWRASTRETRSVSAKSHNCCAWSTLTPKGLHCMGVGQLGDIAWCWLHLDHCEASRTVDKIRTAMSSPDKPGSSTLVCVQDTLAAKAYKKANRFLSGSFYATAVAQMWTHGCMG